jgi:SAM-dependent methyltransferase
MPISSDDKVLAYWDRAVTGFDAIYTGEKPGWSRFLDRFLRRDMYQRFEWVLQNSGDVKNKSICDLGCGTGRYVVAYAQAGAGRVLGIDGAPGMVDKASLLIQQAGLQNTAKVQVAPILDCPEQEVFDISIAVGVFDYTRDALPYIKKIRKITRSRFLATFPMFWSHRAPVRKVRLSLLGCPVYFYTENQIKGLLAAAGFACQRIERMGAIYCVLAHPKDASK